MNHRMPPDHDDADGDEERGETEATAFIPEMSESIPDLPSMDDVPPIHAEPPPVPEDPLERPHTREHFAIATITEPEDSTPQPIIRNKRHRQPAPRRKRPTLMPKNMPLPPEPRPSDSVMQPIHPRQDLSRPDIGASRRESSDVVKTFDSSELDSRPQPLTAANPQVRHPRRDLLRKAAVARRPPSPRRPVSRALSQSVAPQPVLGTLPLSQEALAMLIADQRRRLHVLDGFARGLEISAGVLGTLSLSVLIAALISILVGTDITVLDASSALVSSASALGLTLIMVVAAIALRQIAHLSAQVAALLEALASRR